MIAVTDQILASEISLHDEKAYAHEPSDFKVNAAANIKTHTVFIQSRWFYTDHLLIANAIDN